MVTQVFPFESWCQVRLCLDEELFKADSQFQNPVWNLNSWLESFMNRPCWGWRPFRKERKRCKLSTSAKTLRQLEHCWPSLRLIRARGMEALQGACWLVWVVRWMIGAHLFLIETFSFFLFISFHCSQFFLWLILITTSLNRFDNPAAEAVPQPSRDFRWILRFVRQPHHFRKVVLEGCHRHQAILIHWQVWTI